MTILTCKVDGCGSPKDGAHPTCGKHRRRMRLYGDYSETKNNKPGEVFMVRGYHAAQIDGKKKFTHVRIAEAALGRELPEGAVVHHANGIRDDNRNANLVICPDKKYHNLLHARIRAMEASGDPSKRKCRRCATYDSVENLNLSGAGYWHKSHKRNPGKCIIQKVNIL